MAFRTCGFPTIPKKHKAVQNTDKGHLQLQLNACAVYWLVAFHLDVQWVVYSLKIVLQVGRTSSYRYSYYLFRTQGDTYQYSCKYSLLSTIEIFRLDKWLRKQSPPSVLVILLEHSIKVVFVHLYGSISSSKLETKKLIESALTKICICLMNR